MSITFRLIGMKMDVLVVQSPLGATCGGLSAYNAFTSYLRFTDNSHPVRTNINGDKLLHEAPFKIITKT